MKNNGFTLPFILFIALITILIVTGSSSIFKTQIQYEKQLQNYYLASAELNLALLVAKDDSMLANQLNIKYGSSIIKCQSTDDTLSSFNCNITLENGYTLTKTTNP
ncbi:competence protein ComG [Listeria innocua]|uniref:competence protein ComG n=1 Tax=Listeria innocua TaxID=1642 RepID=UPI000869C9BB|nr:competence protein ComG [Listeria innocua]OEO35428.1 competence protein ComG [Listeria monocytogenes]MBC1440476.1 competence protein ComG [Listeria innocua]MDG0895941.1 competence protein ComG [Listeria innocua]MDH4593501.1 competence protein ComG [Listeria innocua]UVW25689.1 competence protein ComG [Listeria innocua]